MDGRRLLVQILAPGDAETAGLLDEIEHAVAAMENLMDTPLPADQVTRKLQSLGPGRASGAHHGDHGDHIALNRDAIRPGERYAVLAHEVAHYYWRGNAPWLDEGMANLLTRLALESRTGQTGPEVDYSCPHYDNISQLEADPPERETPAFACTYAWGERLLQSLRRKLGQDRFLKGAQALYRQIAQGSDTDTLTRLEQAFGNAATINAWYQEENQRAPARREEHAPTGQLMGQELTVSALTIHTRRGGPPVEEFSASKDAPWRIWVAFQTTARPTAGDRIDATYRLEAQYQDGLVFHRQESQLRALDQGGEPEGHARWLYPGGNDWRPGGHRASLYDGEGNLAATVAWTVLP